MRGESLKKDKINIVSLTLKDCLGLNFQWKYTYLVIIIIFILLLLFSFFIQFSLT